MSRNCEQDIIYEQSVAMSKTFLQIDYFYEQNFITNHCYEKNFITNYCYE